MNDKTSQPPHHEPPTVPSQLPVDADDGFTLDGGGHADPAPAPPTPSGNFPAGSWRSVDYLLHNPRDIVAYIQQDRELWTITLTLLAFSIVMGAFYGVVMGAANFLQGSQVALNVKLLQILVTSLKVPVLFLFSLAVVLPPIYVSNAFVGSHNSFRQVTAMLAAATTITVTVLASMGTVALFFSLTSQSYNFIKLMHVAFFGYAGLVGIGFLRRCLRQMAKHDAVMTSEPLLAAWLLLYGFVGTQLAWVLRPFIGHPNMDFQLFRPRFGNFYENIFQTLEKFLTG